MNGRYHGSASRSRWQVGAAGLLLLLLTSNVQAGHRITQIVGDAYDLESGELLYRETHCVTPDTREREVFYQDQDGKMLARKLVDYGSGATTPSFEQQNFYSSQVIQVELRQNKVTMAVIDANSKKAISEVAVQPQEKLPVVIDAGFDEYVRAHWDSLVAGNNKEFQFPFVDREGLVELRIGPRGCSYDSLTDQCFRLDLANWFLRVLVAPIELGYDPGSRRLIRYRGLSNIGDGEGNGFVVDLQYDYGNVPVSACEAIEQSLALATTN